jgi:hypothetical protein
MLSLPEGLAYIFGCKLVPTVYTTGLRLPETQWGRDPEGPDSEILSIMCSHECTESFLVSTELPCSSVLWGNFLFARYI